MTRRWLVSLVAFVMAAAAHAAQVTWHVDVVGHGPGVGQVTESFVWTRLNCPACAAIWADSQHTHTIGDSWCATYPAQTTVPAGRFSGGGGDCVPAQHRVGAEYPDAVVGPVTISWAYTGGNFWRGVAVNGLGGAQGCMPSAPSAGSITLQKTVPGTLAFNGLWWHGWSTGQLSCAIATGGQPQECAPASPFNNTCNGPPETFAWSVSYLKGVADASVTCMQEGTIEMAPTGEWQPVATISCLPVGTTFDAATCEVATTAQGMQAECKVEGLTIYIKLETICDPAAPVVLTGAVTDKKTGQPIEQAEVVASPGSVKATTGADGGYNLSLAPGQPYQVTATAKGYAPQSAQITPSSCSIAVKNFVLTPNDPCSDKTVGDPVNTLTGEFTHEVTDLRFPGKAGLGFSVRRTYRSLNATVVGPFGNGWTTPLLQVRVQPLTNGDVLYDDEGGAGFRFIRKPDGTFDCGCGTRRTLELIAGGGMRVTTKDGDVEEFDPHGRLVRKATRTGAALAISYGPAGFMVVDAGGRTITFETDPQGKIVRFRDPLNRYTTYSYTTTGDLVEVRGPGSGPSGYVATYDYTDHLLTRMSDPRAAPGQRRLKNTFEGLRVVEQELGQFSIRRWRYQYDQANSITRITDPANHQLVHTYDDEGRIETIRDAAGHVTRMNWNHEAETPAEQVDALGRVTRFTYDSNGNVLTKTDPLNQTTTFTYDPIFSNILTVTDPNGRITSNAYDAQGNLASVSNPQGCGCTTRSYTYDANGQMLTQTDANGHTTTMQYDAFGNQVAVTNAMNQTTRMEFDVLGRRTKITDALGRITRFEYDDGNNLVRQILPDGHTTLMTYDGRGRRLTSTDPNGNITRFEYSEFDDMVRVIDPMNRATNFEFDEEGNLIRLTDANGNSTRHQYDLLNRRTHTIDALGRVTEFAHDAVGNLVLRKDAKGTITRFTFDPLNRLTEQRATDGTWATFAFDAVGNQTRMENNGAAIRYTFDDRYRLVEQRTERIEDRAVDLRLGYTYDPAGNRTSLSYPDGRVIAYELDALSRATKAILPDGSAILQDYTPVGARNTRTFPNGLKTTWKYDSRDQITHILTTDRHGKSTKSGVPGIEYGYDAAGNRLWMDRTDEGRTSYRYDPLNQLIEADFPDKDFQRFEYDPVGNRLQLSERKAVTRYSYDSANQLVRSTRAKPLPPPEFEATDFSFDANGNMQSEFSTQTPHGKSFAWESENRLLSVTLSPNGYTERYAYDAQSRRQVRQAGKETTYSVWDGNLAIFESSTDFSNTILYFKLGGELMGQIGRNRGDARVLSPSEDVQLLLFHGDALGSVLCVTNPTGAVHSRTSYEPFGGSRDESLHHVTLRKFVGMLGVAWEEPTGAYYMWHRYMSLHSGRFLSPDSVRNRYSMSRSLYSYVQNAPQRFVDPEGLQSKYNDPLLQSSNSPVCAWNVYKAWKAYLSGLSNDKFKHCTISCEISYQCGMEISGAVGFAKEVWDVVGPGNAELADLAADGTGIGCSAVLAGSSMCKPQSCWDCCAHKYIPQ